VKNITLVIGKRSNLSKKLSEKLDDIILISSKNVFIDNNLFYKYNDYDVTIILNIFQPATKLNDISDPAKYIRNSILGTAKILSQINGSMRLNKIIYTSSASVYGNNNFCSEDDDLVPLSFQASLKLANEKMIEKFCIDNGIDYTIARIFNMYGGEDKFSIVSKLIQSIRDEESISLINNGSAIRDFIHIDDVVDVYDKLIDNHSIKALNIASGLGVSVKNMIDSLKLNSINIKINNINREEIKISTASIKQLKEIIDVDKFTRVEDFILKNIKDDL